MSIKINPIWVHRLVRLALSGFLLTMAFLYQDAWPLYPIGGIVLITVFLRPVRCLNDAACNKM